MRIDLTKWQSGVGGGEISLKLTLETELITARRYVNT